MFEIFCPRNMLLRKGGSWWQGPSFMRFHRLETGIGLLSWADPWRGAYAALNPIGSFERNGISVSFGSDAPYTFPDPILWIHKAVNHSNPPERVPVRSAVRMATWNGAYAAFDEKGRGSLEEGKVADMVNPVREFIQGSFWIHKGHQSRRSHPWQPSLRKCCSASPP